MKRRAAVGPKTKKSARTAPGAHSAGRARRAPPGLVARAARDLLDAAVARVAAAAVDRALAGGPFHYGEPGGLSLCGKRLDNLVDRHTKLAQAVSCARCRAARDWGAAVAAAVAGGWR